MAGKNIIQKQLVSFTFNTRVASPIDRQQQVSQWCNEMLIPAMEKALEPFAAHEDVIRFDTLVVEWATTNAALDRELATKLAADMVQAIRAKATQGPDGAGRHTRQKSHYESLLFFLQHGYLPWWSSASREEFRQQAGEIVSILSADEKQQLLAVLSNSTAAARLVATFPTNTLVSLLSSITGKKASLIEELIAVITHFSSCIRSSGQRWQFVHMATTRLAIHWVSGVEDDWTAALAQLTERKGDLPGARPQSADQSRTFFLLSFMVVHYDVDLDAIKKAAQEYSGIPVREIEAKLAEAGGEKQPALVLAPSSQQRDQSLPIISKHQPENESLPQDAPQGEAFYINNAGLILLAPFLPRFFANLSITEGDHFNSKDLAIAMLQWLVTGGEDYAEFETVFSKILCGMQAGEPLMVIQDLPEIYKQEGEALLQSVLRHWAILKTTSVEGLRQAFLQRQGKLSFTAGSWLLQVEQKGYDMLVKELPWTISRIKLPWMKTVLKTEWV